MFCEVSQRASRNGGDLRNRVRDQQSYNVREAGEKILASLRPFRSDPAVEQEQNPVFGNFRVFAMGDIR